MIDHHKHETRREREVRHQGDVERSRQRRQPLKAHVQQGFDVIAWEREHQEAETATLWRLRA